MNNNIIPIAFAFDNNLILPACICISSLLINAKEGTFYDIFILHSSNISLKKEELNKLSQYYKNCRIQYRQVDQTFDSAFEIRGITAATYYRLLIPELIPEYDKIIYADVDIIFRMDLSSVYHLDLGNNYIAATRELGMNFTEDGKKYIHSMQELSLGKYIQAGFIIINSKVLKNENMISQFKTWSKKKLRFQDQDILNIVCKGRILYLSLEYNMTDYSYLFAMRKPELLKDLFSSETIEFAINHGNIHFNGHKPWKKYSVNFDIWWEYYRKSPFFDKRFYFEFFYTRLNELDQLSLWKRIKILIRYFVYGKREV